MKMIETRRNPKLSDMGLLVDWFLLLDPKKSLLILSLYLKIDKNRRFIKQPIYFIPSDILSAVASRFNQKETQDKTTNSMQGPYTCIKKFPICRWRWKLTNNIEYSTKNKKTVVTKTHVKHKTKQLYYVFNLNLPEFVSLLKILIVLLPAGVAIRSNCDSFMSSAMATCLALFHLYIKSRLVYPTEKQNVIIL